ncbi:tyrosine-type recombinase/integrase [Actinobacillus pleuropneumoniae]|uniref:tyrosine-type recombinase/integrase n=1 Tax=Actinobacillus pleuropneumoniae TaxID=715 RepID=UPI0038639BCC
MSIYKRKDSAIWWVDVVTPSGSRIRRSSKTAIKKQAQEFHDKLKSQLWDVEILNKSPDRYFEEALLLFLKDGQGQKRFDSKQAHAQYFRERFHGRTLKSLTSEELINAIPTFCHRQNKPLSPATQNRYRSSLLRIFSLAHKAGWVEKIPFIMRKNEPKVRVSWLEKSQAAELINSLKLEWMRNVCTFALLTGARMSEILTLTWDKVNFAKNLAIVSNDKAKSGKARSLPLNNKAIDLLQQIKTKSKSKYVFVRCSTGHAIGDIDRRDFRQACEKIGMPSFHFHDLRHTWASWHVQAGTPLFTLKEMGGWETLEMVRKYAHLNANHMLDYANHVTFTSQ